MMTRSYVITFLAALAACTFVRGKGRQFQEHNGKADDEFQATYYSIREVEPGKRVCTPKGPLKAVLEDQTNCMQGLERCSLGVETVAGRLREDYAKLFYGTLKRTDGEFDYVCRGGENPPDLHLLGLSMLGHSNAASHVDLLLDMDDLTQRDAPWHVAMRPRLAFALFQSGDRQKAFLKLVELALLPGISDEDRARLVLYLGRWNSDGLVTQCTKALTEITSEPMAQACAWYLARRKIADAVPLFGNADPRLGLTGLRALGWSGDPKAVEMVTRAMNPATATDVQRIVARVALLNLGKKEALKDFLGMIAGNVGSRRSGNETSKLAPDEVVHEAALECMAISNHAFDRDIMKALRKATSSKVAKVSAAAWIALAYLNDELAVDNLAQIITGKDESARALVVAHVGAQSEKPGRHAGSGSEGVLNDPRLRDALLTQYTPAAVDAPGRLEAIQALANMHPTPKE